MEYLPKWIGAADFIALCRISESTLADLALNHDLPLYWDHSLERIDPKSRLIRPACTIVCLSIWAGPGPLPGNIRTC